VPDIALNLVVLRTTDLERSAAFYSCLGVSFVRHRHGNGPEHLAAEMPGVVFELYPSSTDTTPTKDTRIGFTVASLDAALTALAEFPGAIVSPPKDSPWGRRAVAADPDGHRVELVER
jgi:predicted enzyme related to lactoylglutathione lyase